MDFQSFQKPARYVGGEYNSVDSKKISTAKVKFCLSFPESYEIAMSNLGWKILYHMINERSEYVCERCFAPSEDLSDYLEQNNLQLFSIESKTNLMDFDIVGFSLQYELAFTTILHMLKLAQIPLWRQERANGNYPLIIGGGASAYNVEPMADFFDLFIIGEAEIALMQVLELFANNTREEFFEKVKTIEGVYIPSKLKIQEREGKIVGFEYDGTAKKAFVPDLDVSYYPCNQIVPSVETVHDRGVVELFRGCARGCRFCQAGFCYRPLRFKSKQTVVSQVKTLVDKTGFEEISLSSLSSGDYADLLEVKKDISEFISQNRVKVQLPSLRLDSFNGAFSEDLKKAGLTFAPEAGTQRLRDVINKNITEKDIEKSFITAFSQGYTSVKLYFMIGLPTETMEDVEGIANIVLLAKSLYGLHAKIKKPLKISVSVSTFVPKPFTPFAYERFNSEEEIAEKIKLLIKILRLKNVSFSWNDYKTSLLECVLSRGDRKLSRVLYDVHLQGGKYESERKYFDYEKYRKAFEKLAVDIEDYTKEMDTHYYAGWEFLDIGIKREYFLQERERAKRGETTQSCFDKCNGCIKNCQFSTKLVQQKEKN